MILNNKVHIHPWQHLRASNLWGADTAGTANFSLCRRAFQLRTLADISTTSSTDSIAFKVRDANRARREGKDHYLVSVACSPRNYRLFSPLYMVCIWLLYPYPSYNPVARASLPAADSLRTCNPTATLPFYSIRPRFYTSRWMLSVCPGDCSRLPCNHVDGKWHLTSVLWIV